MAKTTTNLINSATIAAGYLYGVQPKKADISTATTLTAALEATVTNGSVPPIKGNLVKVHYGFSNTNITDLATVVGIIKPTGYISLVMNDTASSVTVADSQLIPATANYLYAWVETVNLSQPITLKLDVVYI